MGRTWDSDIWRSGGFTGKSWRLLTAFGASAGFSGVEDPGVNRRSVALFTGHHEFALFAACH